MNIVVSAHDAATFNGHVGFGLDVGENSIKVISCDSF